MGGGGSGRWGGHTKKGLVEDCHSLDAGQWAREGIFREGVLQTGRWIWRNARTGKETASLGYLVNTKDPIRPTVHLVYTVTLRSGEKEEVVEPIRLQNTPLPWGGVRWWFTCPLEVDGKTCGRRVRKLYLPPGGRYFGCRHCYDLTYRSVQEHDRRVDALVKNPLRLFRLLESGDPGDLLLGLRAAWKMTGTGRRGP
jgi:hypothetical protein